MDEYLNPYLHNCFICKAPNPPAQKLTWATQNVYSTFKHAEAVKNAIVFECLKEVQKKGKLPHEV